MGTILECEYLEWLSTSSETQGHLVGTTGFSRAKVYNRSCCKLSPVKIPSSRLGAPGSPRMGFLALFEYLFSFWNRYNGSFFSFHIPTIVIIPVMLILILKETKTVSSSECLDAPAIPQGAEESYLTVMLAEYSSRKSILLIQNNKRD